MKNILMTMAATVLLSTGAFADTSTMVETHPDGSKTVTTTKSHRENPDKCWPSDGNWVGGKNLVSCEFSSGSVEVREIPAPAPSSKKN